MEKVNREEEKNMKVIEKQGVNCKEYIATAREDVRENTIYVINLRNWNKSTLHATLQVKIDKARNV